ncbi:hypothetical protein LEP1GSC172_1163 [Leptospira noguchii]|uniref:Uncharacterized protein n=2 Tax=Leptospira noguchii TaxID=28182 RepID=T0FKC6_9LEPT|nr:hypothetical protein LEP1GSC172_1163 [Leptospira noguchii]EQA70035.1 hypothetical protein LEP1GSC059_2046 [Leptospira noguchii serovar Panama str. CZ214]
MCVDSKILFNCVGWLWALRFDQQIARKKQDTIIFLISIYYKT